MTMTGEQLRAARAMLRLEQGQLADLAGISGESVKRFEAMTGEIQARAATIDALRNAIERKGVMFITEPGLGVCMNPKPDDPRFPKPLWVDAVSNRATDLGYWDWVDAQKQNNT